MLLIIGNFLKKNIGYLILISIIIFISYRLFDKPESTKILEKQLEEIRFEKDSLISNEQSYKVTVDLLKEQNKRIKLQKAILLSKFNKLNLDINNKIKQDEANISNIDSLSPEDIDNILTNYKYTPIKTKN